MPPVRGQQEVYEQMDTLNDKTLLKDKCFVNGQWIGGSETVNVTNPATGEVITTVPKLGAKETEDAVAGEVHDAARRVV